MKLESHNASIDLSMQRKAVLSSHDESIVSQCSQLHLVSALSGTLCKIHATAP